MWSSCFNLPLDLKIGANENLKKKSIYFIMKYVKKIKYINFHLNYIYFQFYSQSKICKINKDKLSN